MGNMALNKVVEKAQKANWPATDELQCQEASELERYSDGLTEHLPPESRQLLTH